MDSTPAFRYIDGKLVSFDVPAGRPYWQEAISQPDVFRAMLRFKPEPRQVRGVYMLDLRREQARSGVPSWFRPDLSRRRRCVAWAATPKATREERRLAAVGPVAQVRTLVAHRFAREETRATWEGALERDRAPRRVVSRLEVLLYLPEGEQPTEQHGRDLDRALARVGAMR